MCCVTKGPEATNTVIVVASAQNGSLPLIIISGQFKIGGLLADRKI